MTLSHSLLYLTAAALPFPAMGILLTGNFPLSPAIFFGTAYSLLGLVTRGMRRSHLAAGGMLLAFLVTAMPRFEYTSYALSMCALGVAIAPLTVPVFESLAWQRLLSGFLLGLYLTLSIIWVEVGAQVLGIGLISEALQLIFPYGGQGVFINLLRPKAGFLEPSHLAIYLCFAFAVLDICKDLKNGFVWQKAMILVALLAVGSLSGIVIIFIYLTVSSLQDLPLAVRNLLRGRAMFYALLSLILAVSLIAYFYDTVVQAIDLYSTRLDKTLIALGEGGLEGSEGSRINALKALPKYWSEFGISGFLFGTGYANYEDWLIKTYEYLGPWSTFARGQIDNMLVAVFLSTGLVGMSAYLLFTLWVLRHAEIKRATVIGVFLITVNFAFGYLVLYLYWYLLFVLTTALRFHPYRLQITPKRPYGRTGRPLPQRL